MAQNQKTPDELYAEARTKAFEEKNYADAIDLIKRARVISPDYLELGVFLGRLYTFTDSLPKARTVLNEVLIKEPGREDASLAYGNLEYWNSNTEEALTIVNKGIVVHPDSQSLNILKAKILKDLGQYGEARIILDELLKQNPKLTEARSIISSMNTAAAKNSVGINYEFVYFDERFDNPWHLAHVEYGRQTRLGAIFGRLNYANRFQTGGTQFEIDAYPRISNLFYCYVNGGISNTDGIFPKYKAGFSLYANLPAAFEIDGGFRFLAFDDNTWIYTVGLGKYYSNYWFNLRTYLTPSQGALAHSYVFTARYYLGGADDFLSLKLGTGLSPDNSTNSILFNPDNGYRLKSNNIALVYRKLFWQTNVLNLAAAFENQEFARNRRGNQLSFSIGYIKRF
ncbi:MAG: YaiO family outer membrane beta-barrel protein [Leeuwenhoekiella sp.]